MAGCKDPKKKKKEKKKGHMPINICSHVHVVFALVLSYTSKVLVLYFEYFYLEIILHAAVQHF